MTKIPYLKKGTPTVKGYYGVNTVDFIPSLLEWTGDKWIYPDGRFIEYPKADVISWVLVASNEDAVTIHKPQEMEEMTNQEHENQIRNSLESRVAELEARIVGLKEEMSRYKNCVDCGDPIIDEGGLCPTCAFEMKAKVKRLEENK